MILDLELEKEPDFETVLYTCMHAVSQCWEGFNGGAFNVADAKEIVRQLQEYIEEVYIVRALSRVNNADLIRELSRRLEIAIVINAEWPEYTGEIMTTEEDNVSP